MSPEADDRYCRSLFLLPICTFVLVPGCFSITYLIAVSKDHVHPMLPMISETGEELPENFVFATIVNCGSFLASLTYMARFLVVSSWARAKPAAARRGRVSVLNRLSLTVALIGGMGALIVGNVEANRHHQLHYVGAGTVVIMQLAYCWLQAHISHCAPLAAHSVTVARYALSAAATAAFVAGATLSPWAYSVPHIHETLLRNDTVLQTARFIGYRWVSDEHVYFDALLLYHITEWFIVVAAGLFLLSFAVEFKKVHVQIPKLQFSLSPASMGGRRRDAYEMAECGGGRRAGKADRGDECVGGGGGDAGAEQPGAADRLVSHWPHGVERM